MAFLRRIVLRNDRPKPLVLFVELEAWDYWLMPGEEFELRAESSSEDAEFDFDDRGDEISVYPANEMGQITVHQDDKQLDGGHNRPKDWPRKNIWADRV